jgi:hypothetical protein
VKIDTTKLGAAMLAAGPLLVQFGGSKVTWYLGVLFAAIAPFMMSCKFGKEKGK